MALCYINKDYAYEGLMLHTRYLLTVSTPFTSKNSDTLSKYAEIDSLSGWNSPTLLTEGFVDILVANCNVCNRYGRIQLII